MEIYFWKKYLNQNLIEFDARLLKNFYLNQGYYNVEINTSFARLVENNNFELIYNIDAKEKFYFNNINLNLPNDFELKHFKDLDNLFKKLRANATQ